MSRISEDQAAYIISLYNQLGSVWKVAELIDRCGQSVHEFLTRRGVIKANNIFSDDDFNILKSKYIEYRDTGRLQELADSLGRTKQFICRKAKELGLTSIPYNRTDKHTKNLNKALSKMWEGKVHPRGMKGKTHSEQYKKIRSEYMKDEWKNPNSFFNSEKHRNDLSERMSLVMTNPKNRKNNYSRCKRGHYTSGERTFFMRSSWEIIYAAYLDNLVTDNNIAFWDYEAKTFFFKDKIKSYTPDFMVQYHDNRTEWHEVKGWMDDKSKRKLELMKINYPNELIKIIDEKFFKNK